MLVTTDENFIIIRSEILAEQGGEVPVGFTHGDQALLLRCSDGRAALGQLGQGLQLLLAHDGGFLRGLGSLALHKRKRDTNMVTKQNTLGGRGKNQKTKINQKRNFHFHFHFHFRSKWFLP